MNISIIISVFGLMLFLKGFIRRKKLGQKYLKEYHDAVPKPSDEQMDDWRKSDIRRVVNQDALKRLGLYKEDCQTGPLVIAGTEFLEEKNFAISSKELEWYRRPPKGEPRTSEAIGQDGKKRYSHLKILVIFLTEYHITTYECVTAMESGQILADRTLEFPYKEITNLGTEIILRRFWRGRQDIHERFGGDGVCGESGWKKFTLATSGQNQIKVEYSFSINQEFSENREQEPFSVDDPGEKAILAIRKYLKDYERIHNV